MMEQITAYMLQHGDSIKQQLTTVMIPYDPILREEYIQAFISEIILILTLALNLNYIDVAEIVTEEFIVKLMGEQYL